MENVIVTLKVIDLAKFVTVQVAWSLHTMADNDMSPQEIRELMNSYVIDIANGHLKGIDEMYNLLSASHPAVGLN